MTSQRGSRAPAYRPLVGARIRERRRALGVTQIALAARAGISPSYLNLIEGNKRNIGGNLLKRLAGELGVAIDELDGAAERRLVDDLAGLVAEPLLADLRLDPDSADDVAGRHGNWARALVRLHRAWIDRSRAVGALSDRLTHDPFLADAVHSLLSQVAAIRSSSEILETFEDLEPGERRRFVSIVGAESSRLGDVAQALATFFEKAHTQTRSITPADEVDDFLLDRENHFPELEAAAADFRTAAAIEGLCSESGLIGYLGRVHSVQVQRLATVSADPRNPRQHAFFDAATRTLHLLDAAPRSTRRFQLARLAIELFHRGAPVSAELARAPGLTSEAARRRARRVLGSYVAAAVLMPYDSFHEAAIRARYDVDRLARRFETSFEQTCHRLVTLRRPGAEGIPFGFMRIDPAGYVTKRFPLPHLPLPRHGNACPLWAAYQAFQSPGALVRQLAEFPNGARYLFVGRTDEKVRPTFTMPRRMMAMMLACDALYADRTVYADGLDISSAAPAIPVGPNCRVCVRRDCWYREEDPIIDA